MSRDPKIFLAVTNDLSYDQRMQRICTTLANAGYEVTLVGREMPDSPPLTEKPFRQVRLSLRHQRGKRFYAEYNWKLYRFLRGQQMDAICAIDLDTIVPAYHAARMHGIPCLYDAHEYFTELTEVRRRPAIRAAWLWVERNYVPHIRHGYTVSHSIAAELNKRYGVAYDVVRNLPLLQDAEPDATPPKGLQELLQQKGLWPVANTPAVLYQGAVNEGRALPALVASMQEVPAQLWIAGTGNLMQQVTQSIDEHGLGDRVFMLGNVLPEWLPALTRMATVGVNLVENTGLSQYFSLANKFFDYIHAGLPQLTMDYPEYRALVNADETALLTEDLSPAAIAARLNHLLTDNVLYNRLKLNCLNAARHLHWAAEEPVLLQCWQKALNP